MRSLFYLVSTLAVMALAAWAYSENYRTKAALAERGDVMRAIAETREGIVMLGAEWAYLNRPERLRELVDLNYESLGLQPMTAAQLADVAR